MTSRLSKNKLSWRRRKSIMLNIKILNMCLILFCKHCFELHESFPLILCFNNDHKLRMASYLVFLMCSCKCLNLFLLMDEMSTVFLSWKYSGVPKELIRFKLNFFGSPSLSLINMSHIHHFIFIYSRKFNNLFKFAIFNLLYIYY
jgi:hypothetical protein